MKKVEVTWRDSHRYSYQMSKDEPLEVAVITTVGYLVRKERKCVVLCQDNIMGDIRGVIVIPKENITKIKIL